MFSSIIQTFWPSINKEEVKKFSLLSLTLACLIGSYWTMRLVKDVIMFKIAFPESLVEADGSTREMYALDGVHTNSIANEIWIIEIISKLGES